MWIIPLSQATTVKTLTKKLWKKRRVTDITNLHTGIYFFVEKQTTNYAQVFLGLTTEIVEEKKQIQTWNYCLICRVNSLIA